MISFKDENELVPCIVQDERTLSVRMLGYMNKEAYETTEKSGYVTFYSRSKKRLWKKGESSGNVLKVKSMSVDCDQDTVLVQAEPTGPTCHTGATTCFGDPQSKNNFIADLEALIERRRLEPNSKSYTSSLFKKGRKKIAQKVGEEGVEVALAAATGDRNEVIDETADLLFHTLVLLSDSGIRWQEVVDRLESRNSK